MSLVGGGQTGSVGGVETASGPSSSGGGSSTDETKTLFDLVLSFGHGVAADQELAAGVSFWFTPTTIADLSVANQVREWVTDEAIGFLALDAHIDAASFGEAGAGRLVVTVAGVDTALALAISDGASGVHSTSALLNVAAGSTLGVRWDPGSVADVSTFRAEIRLRGAATGTPIVPDTLPANALALYRPADLAADGTSWTDSVVGHLYSLTVPNFGPPPFGFLHQISGPVVLNDGSFNSNKFGRFSAYHALDGNNYTPMMLATTVSMFAQSAVPIAPRTVVAVCRPTSSIGGVAAATQSTTPCFQAALYKPTGDLQQSAYFNITVDAATTLHVATPVNLGGEELVMIWRTDGTHMQFFINGVQQVLDSDLVGTDAAAGEGFCMGNLRSAQWISDRGWQGDICFEGVWARKFTDDEVLSATANLSGLYVTP